MESRAEELLDSAALSKRNRGKEGNDARDNVFVESSAADGYKRLCCSSSWLGRLVNEFSVAESGRGDKAGESARVAVAGAQSLNIFLQGDGRRASQGRELATAVVMWKTLSFLPLWDGPQVMA